MRKALCTTPVIANKAVSTYPAGLGSADWSVRTARPLAIATRAFCNTITT
ncbi:hypothetical protein NBT05_16980 [Aquimarina sp. ERC-38]|nr:hypothetical protein [Aquimarina sp. ERC-38]UZO80623.1 hypothetical protein NBT05_16980 [Aquimarina sp. ERC-38]